VSRRPTPRRALAAAAGLVIVALTAAAFWLSYAHLAGVAFTHGLQTSPVRAWAWPACLDLFIVAGELLMLRAALTRSTDWWAIGLTVIGSGGSIALNVAGVGTTAAALDYVVAAVPPTAALLAFGALMRQVHQALAGTAPAPMLNVEPSPPAVEPPAPAMYPDPAPDRVHHLPDAPGAPGDSAPVHPVPALPGPAPDHAPDPGAIPATPDREPLPLPAGYALAAVPAAVPRHGVHTQYAPDAPEPDALLPRVRADFAGVLADNRIPTLRTLRDTYAIGQPRAQRLQRALSGGDA
jgi:hypothetical protein